MQPPETKVPGHHITESPVAFAALHNQQADFVVSTLAVKQRARNVTFARLSTKKKSHHGKKEVIRPKGLKSARHVHRHQINKTKRTSPDLPSTHIHSSLQSA